MPASVPTLPARPLRIGISFECQPGQTPLITGVERGSPAERAGLRLNDRIVSVGDFQAQSATLQRLADELAVRAGGRDVMIQIARHQDGVGMTVFPAVISVDSGAERQAVQDAIRYASPPRQAVHFQGPARRASVRQYNEATRPVSPPRDEHLPRRSDPGLAEPRWMGQKDHERVTLADGSKRDRDLFEQGADIIDGLWAPPTKARTPPTQSVSSHLPPTRAQTRTVDAEQQPQNGAWSSWDPFSQKPYESSGVQSRAPAPRQAPDPEHIRQQRARHHSPEGKGLWAPAGQVRRPGDSQVSRLSQQPNAFRQQQRSSPAEHVRYPSPEGRGLWAPAGQVRRPGDAQNSIVTQHTNESRQQPVHSQGQGLWAPAGQVRASREQRNKSPSQGGNMPAELSRQNGQIVAEDWLLVQQESSQAYSTSKKIMASDETATFTPAGYMDVVVHKASDLPMAAAFGLGDTYCSGSVGKSVLKTRVVSNSVNPTFNTVLRFRDSQEQTISIRVMNKTLFGDSEIGRVTVPWADAQQGQAKEFTLFTGNGDAVHGEKRAPSRLRVQALIGPGRVGGLINLTSRAAHDILKGAPDWGAYRDQGTPHLSATEGVTITLDEDYAVLKPREGTWQQQLRQDVCSALRCDTARFQYVGMRGGSVLATFNLRPAAAGDADRRSARNLAAELALQVYDARSALKAHATTARAVTIILHPPHNPQRLWDVPAPANPALQPSHRSDQVQLGHPAPPPQQLLPKSQVVFGTNAYSAILEQSLGTLGLDSTGKTHPELPPPDASQHQPRTSAAAPGGQEGVRGSSQRPAFGPEVFIPIIDQMLNPKPRPAANGHETSKDLQAQSPPPPVSNSGLPSAAAIRMRIALPFEYCGADGSADREQFKTAVTHDLANAAGLPHGCFNIVAVSPGSILVDTEIYVDENLAAAGRDPLSAALDLQRQASIRNSPLKTGAVTRHCDGIEVFHVRTPEQELSTQTRALDERRAAENKAQYQLPSHDAQIASLNHAPVDGGGDAELILTVYDVNLVGVHGQPVFFCASLLAPADEHARMHQHVLHKMPGATGDGIEPQFTSVEKSAAEPVTQLNEKLAFSHFVQGGQQLGALARLRGEPAHIFVSLHLSSQPSQVLGQVLLPASLGQTLESHKFELLDHSNRPVVLAGGQQAAIRLGYNYQRIETADASTAAQQVPPGPEPATDHGRGGDPAPPPPLQNLKPAPYNLAWDSDAGGVADGRDVWDELWAPAGQVKERGQDNKEPAHQEHTAAQPATASSKRQAHVQSQRNSDNTTNEAEALTVYEQDDGVPKRDKRPAKAMYRMHAKQQAVKALKALKQHGWEVIAVGVGDEAYALQVHDKLWELGLVGPASPLESENIVFVQHSSQVKEVSKQLGAVLGFIDHDWNTTVSMQGHVEPGCRCVLLQPKASDRDKFRTNLLAREKAEASQSDKLQLLNRTIASLRTVEEELLQNGVDMNQVIGQQHTASDEPGVKALIKNFMEKETEVVQLTKEVEEAATLSSVPIVCCPRSRTEMMLAGGRSADAWTQACEVLGLDAAVVAVQDGKCIQYARPEGVQGAPFYPVSNNWHQRRTQWDEMCERGKVPSAASAGVGIVTVVTDKNLFAVASIEYGSPAYCSQMLRVGDVIVSIDGILLEDLMTSEVNRLLTGPPGSPVTVGVAAPGSLEEVFYVYLTRKCTPTACKFGKGRLIMLVDEIFLVEELAPKSDRALLRVRLHCARNLPGDLPHEAVFGMIKLSTFSPLQEEQMHSTAPVRQSSPAEFYFGDDYFDMDLHDPVRQRIEVQIFCENPNKLELSAPVGRAVLSTQEVVTATMEGWQEGQWWRLLSNDYMVIVGPGGLPSEVKITAQVLSSAQARAENVKEACEQLPALAVQHSKDEARIAQTVGVTLTIDDDYERQVGTSRESMRGYAKELALDLAAALYTSDDRFIVCGLTPGSIIAFVNIVPDEAGVDLRSPKALAMLLKDQSIASNSMLRFARTTKGIRDVEVCAPFNEPATPIGTTKLSTAEAPRRELAPRENQQSMVPKQNSIEASGRAPMFGKPAQLLAPKERAGVLLSGLADGQLRAQNPALRKMPAVVSFTFGDDEPKSLTDKAVVEQLRLEAAKCIYMPPSMVEIGEVDGVNRMVDVCIFPDNHISHTAGRRPEDDGKHRELAMQPGVQHILASQLVGRIFEQGKGPTDIVNPMRDTKVLKHAIFAQCIKEPGNPRTRKVVADMIGPMGTEDQTWVEEVKDESAEMRERQGYYGVGLTSTAPVDKKIWVSDPTLGSVWEELRDENNLRYWISHKDSVISKSNPGELWPLPPSWEQRVDDHRRLQYRFTSSGSWQLEHPCAAAVVYGVLVRGKGACMVALRHLSRERGWRDMQTDFFRENPWASGLLEFAASDDGYITVYDRSQPSEGLPDDVVAVYNLKCEHPHVPPVEIPVLEAPPQGEEFPVLRPSMVEMMLKQYPPGSYMVWRSDATPRPPAGEDYLPILISAHSAPGQVIHRLCHVVGPAAAKPNSLEAGWVLVDPNEQPWNLAPEELAMKGLIFESVGELVNSRAIEYSVRIDPTGELPSSRRGVRDADELQRGGTAEPFRALRRPVIRRSNAAPMQTPQSAARSERALETAREAQIVQELQSLRERQVSHPPPTSMHASTRTVLTVGIKRAATALADGQAGIGVGLQRINNPELPFSITEIIPDGPAGMDGRICVGDVILQVEGQDVSPLTEEQVTKLIRGTPASEVRLTLSRAEFLPDAARQRPALNPKSRALGTATSVFDIEIMRGAPAPDGLGGLGVVMQATGNDAMPYVVNSIEPDGTAFQDGRLRVGDGLLMLDGKSIVTMDISDVTSLVRGTPGSFVKMTVSRQASSGSETVGN